MPLRVSSASFSSSGGLRQEARGVYVPPFRSVGAHAAISCNFVMLHALRSGDESGVFNAIFLIFY